MRTLVLALALPFALGVRAGDPHPEGAAQPALARVVLLGASVTAGFGAIVVLEEGATKVTTSATLGDALAATVPALGEVLSAADVMLFTRVVESGERLVEEARGREPTCVVALDYLFWFAYGSRDGGAERTRLLEQGLERLARFECPVLVGDLPDVRDAPGLRAVPYSRPSDAELAALQARVRAWILEDERRTLVPLADLVATLAADAELELGGARWPPGSRAELSSEDGLHATLEGLVPLARLVALALVEADLGLEARELVAPADVPARIVERVALQRDARKSGLGLELVPAGGSVVSER